MNDFAFIILNIADAFLTKEALKLGGQELNPLMFSTGSDPWVKGLLALGIVIALRIIGKENVLYFLCIAMACVVFWNAIVIFLMIVARMIH